LLSDFSLQDDYNFRKSITLIICLMRKIIIRLCIFAAFIGLITLGGNKMSSNFKSKATTAPIAQTKTTQPLTAVSTIVNPAAPTSAKAPSPKTSPDSKKAPTPTTEPGIYNIEYQVTVIGAAKWGGLTTPKSTVP
jgi:hypothetical protein